MPRPDGGLVTETNRQYYAGAQQQYSATGGVGITMTSTFDTDLIFGSSDPTNGQYGLNNFLLYKSKLCRLFLCIDKLMRFFKIFF